MAIAFVQKLATEVALATNASSIAFTTTASCASGDYIVGFASTRLSTQAIATSVADNSASPLTWTVDTTEAGPGTNFQAVSVFSAQAPSGLASGTVVTVTLSGLATRRIMGLYEFSGVASSTAVGVTAVNQGSTGNPSVTLGSSATAGDLVFAAFEHNVTGTTGTQTPAAGFTSLGSAVAGSATWAEGYAQYKVDSTGTADAAGYTPSVDKTTAWDAAAVCYHQASIVTPPRNRIVASRIRPVMTQPLAGYR